MSIAPSTGQSYLSGLNAYVKFLLLCNIVSHVFLPSIPTSQDLLMYFAAFCFDRLKLSYSTIKLYICGVRFHCIKYGMFFPNCTDMPRLLAVLNGIKRCNLKPNNPRLPVTFDILQKICKLLRSNPPFHNFENILLQAVCTIAFFGFLRCGEFTVTRNFDPNFNLCMADLQVQEGVALLHLKVSKTDPFRQGITIKLFGNNSGTCPVHSSTKYLKLRNLSNPAPSDPLFVNKDGRPLTRTTFISMFRETLKQIGIDPSPYNGHSFRIGAATSAANANIEDHLIKVLGRWSSDSYCRYIRTSTQTLKGAQTALTNPPSH